MATTEEEHVRKEGAVRGTQFFGQKHVGGDLGPRKLIGRGRGSGGGGTGNEAPTSTFSKRLVIGPMGYPGGNYIGQGAWPCIDPGTWGGGEHNFYYYFPSVKRTHEQPLVGLLFIKTIAGKRALQVLYLQLETKFVGICTLKGEGRYGIVLRQHQ